MDTTDVDWCGTTGEAGADNSNSTERQKVPQCRNGADKGRSLDRKRERKCQGR